MQFQWYPGHMTKAKRQMQEDIKLIDLVIELVDARIPLASRNPDIDELGKNKARLILMNKSDLSDAGRNREWSDFFREKGYYVVCLDARSKAGMKDVTNVVMEACKEKIERDRKRGIKNRPVRAMVVGIPNVGKSTFINSYAGKACAKTGNKPGVTKGKQWIRLNKNVELLDTPGILWPKFEDQRVGLYLALIGAIKDEILNIDELSLELIKILLSDYPTVLKERYGVEEDAEPPVILGQIAEKHPEAKIVCNAKTVGIIKQFFDLDIDSRSVVVKEGDTLCTGKHNLTFVMAPMVHWPEVMVTYDTTDKTLFSADAFGTFGAMNGNLFADEVNFERDWLDDARRYYTNIVGKYGVQVQTLLKKAAGLEIATICPLHGPVWRENISWYVDKYLTWSSYAPEEKSVMIAYGSIYGNTENAANILACKLADKGVRNIAVYDVSATHPSQIVSEAFRCSHLVFAAATYNGGIFTNMEHVLNDLKAHGLQNRTVAVIENGTWGVVAGKQMKEILSGMKNMNILEQTVTVKSALKDEQDAQLEALADAIVASLQ